MARVRDHGPHDRHLSFLSFAHFAEQFMCGPLHALAGYRVLVARSRRLPEALAAMRPTFIMGVPSEWQSIRDALAGGLALDGVRLCLSTGAPLAPELRAQLATHGVTIHELYGMTETSGAATYDWRALDGSRIEVAADGEVRIWGPRFRAAGYLDDTAADAETFDGEWVRTGDLGALDGDGSLRLTGRKKELIALANGKKVHPAPLEARLCALGARHAVVLGEARPFLVAVLDADDPDAAVAALNRALPRHQQVRAFLRAAPFTVENGELTASLKVRREAVAARYRAALEALYRRDIVGEP
jgi:long-chain acyl-CoA synthetase